MDSSTVQKTLIYYKNLFYKHKLLMMNESDGEARQYPAGVRKDVERYMTRRSVQQFKETTLEDIHDEYNILSLAVSKTPEEYIQLMAVGHREKDRFSNVHVYKHNRVKVPEIEDFYINACEMKSAFDKRPFAIFAQAPVQEAQQDFFLACYYQRISKIFMLCPAVDRQRGLQAIPYFPAINSNIDYNDLKITTVKCQEMSPLLTKRLFNLRGLQGERYVQHLQWVGHLDGVVILPQKETHQLLDIINLAIQAIQAQQLIVIQSSSGVGRTGVFGSIIEAIRCVRKNKVLSLFQIVDNLRKQREGCIRTFKQYSFVYQLLKQIL